MRSSLEPRSASPHQAPRDQSGASVTDGRGTRALRPSMRTVLKSVLGAQTFGKMRALRRMASREELRLPYSLRFKLRAWSHGFTVEQAVLYDLERRTVSDYISDYERIHRCNRLNPVREIFSQKLILRRLLADRGFVQADAIALVTRHGVIEDPMGERARHVAAGALEARLIAEGGRYIAKPQDGMYGRGISLLEVRGGQLLATRGAHARPYSMARDASEGTLIERAIDQHPFWAALCPTSVNTIRVLTLWTPGEDEPFVARAIQRMGAAATAPTDNWDGGGVAAVIDPATGRLGFGRVNPFRTKAEDRPYTHHPDSGARIEGIVLPFWNNIVDTVLAATRRLPLARYVGWDVAVDENGNVVIVEGNHNTGVRLLQFESGLLTDARVRRFYEASGVVTRASSDA